MRTVSEILQQKGPHFNFIEADAVVLDAITLMKCENISYLIVLNEGIYAGIITERDYAQKVMLNNKHSDKTLVKEIMTTDLPIVSFSESAEQCMVLMNAAKSRYLPVFDSTEFKGIITIHDLMREAIAYSQQNIDVVLKKKPEQHYWI